MATIHKSIDIDAPAERVFEILTDPRRLPEYASGLISVEDIRQTEQHLGDSFRATYAALGLHFPMTFTAGLDGNLWFTEYNGNKIGRITPSGTITEFPLPTGASGFKGSTAGPSGITTGPDGNLWFIEPDGNKIGRITPGGRATGLSAPNPLIQSGGPFVRRTPAW